MRSLWVVALALGLTLGCSMKLEHRIESRPSKSSRSYGKLHNRGGGIASIDVYYGGKYEGVEVYEMPHAPDGWEWQNGFLAEAKPMREMLLAHGFKEADDGSLFYDYSYVTVLSMCERDGQWEVSAKDTAGKSSVFLRYVSSMNDVTAILEALRGGRK